MTADRVPKSVFRRACQVVTILAIGVGLALLVVGPLDLGAKSSQAGFPAAEGNAASVESGATSALNPISPDGSGQSAYDSEGRSHIAIAAGSAESDLAQGGGLAWSTDGANVASVEAEPPGSDRGPLPVFVVDNPAGGVGLSAMGWPWAIVCLAGAAVLVMAGAVWSVRGGNREKGSGNQ